MKKEDVPQDAENSTYGGVRKLIYAQDESGHYVGVKSSGWDVEASATQSALTLIHEQCEDALARGRERLTSPLEYYMYYRRMDLALLSQTTGMFKWRIRRHFRPEKYEKLGNKVLGRYSEALGLDIEQLKTLPEKPLHEQ